MTFIKDLGLVAGIIKSATAPSNKEILWRDTTAGNVKYYDTTLAAWTSLSQGPAGPADYNDLLNLPTLFSGDYSDLSNVPAPPTLATALANGFTTGPNDISMDDGQVIRSTNDNAYISLRSSNVAGRISLSNALYVDSANNRVSVGTTNALSGARFSVNGAIGTPNHLLTYGGTNTYFYAVTGTNAIIGAASQSSYVTINRGIYEDMWNDASGTSFRKNGPVTDAEFEFYTQGAYTGKMLVRGKSTGAGGGNQIGNVQFDLISTYYDPVLNTNNNLAKTELKQRVLDSTGLTEFQVDVKGTNVLKAKEDGSLETNTIQVSDGSRVESLLADAYFDPKFNNAPGEAQIHADEHLYITTNFRKKIIIGGYRNSGNTLPPVWIGSNSIYQQVQLNGVNFQGNISFGAGLNSSGPIIGIGAPYTQIRWGNLFITPVDSVHGGTSFRTVSKFSFIDVYGKEMMSIRNSSFNKILELGDLNETTGGNAQSINYTGQLRVKHKYWNKAVGDVSGASIENEIDIFSVRYSEDAGINYKGAGIVEYGGIEALRFLEDGETIISTDSAMFDKSTIAGDTRFLLYDVDSGSMQRVTVGSANSGGAGFKVLRIPN